MPDIHLMPHQQQALNDIRSGSILCGGVGSGKSITSLAYFFVKECKGAIWPDGQLAEPTQPKNLYIITTAMKRDRFEWDSECSRFLISVDKEKTMFGINVVIDSWNNIKKYETVENAFFIFDEQRIVGWGAWTKAFLKIAKKNRWILLSATPGDTWLDYIPVFVANGFYPNKSSFLRRHAVYNRYSKYPKIDRFMETGHLEHLRQSILVKMDFERTVRKHYLDIPCTYDPIEFDRIVKERWNPFDDEPIRDIAQACYLMRKSVNSHPSRLVMVREIAVRCSKLIVFYNYDYELDILKTLADENVIAEWNGHKHEKIPDTTSWIYLVQYNAGSEGWNCTDTDTIIFYSQNYSYKMMTQAAGRIDRMNTKFEDLYYYNLKSRSLIDNQIARALKSKKTFNEKAFAAQLPMFDIFAKEKG